MNQVRKISSKECFYPESAFGGFTDIDGTIVFFSRVNSILDPSFVVLDVGCGRGEYVDDPVAFRKNLRIFKGRVAKVVGIDVDEAARSNPYLDEFKLIKGEEWPIESESIDLIVSDNVLEHVNDPGAYFSEIRRVLKDGGLLCIRTPNRWSYVSIATSLIPNRHHFMVKAVVQDKAKQEDTFPTVFKCNSTRKIRRAMSSIGFDCVVYTYEAEPSYLSFSKIAYYIGVLHQRFALGFMKPAIFAFGRIKKTER